MSEFNDCDTQLTPKGAPNPLEDREHEGALWAKRMMEVPSNMQMRIVYDADGREQYIGYAARGLAEGTNGWLLHYLQYNANGQMTSRTIGYDSWTNYLTATYA